MKRKIWFTAAIALFLFEWLRVYFIMPMPGSQQFNTLDSAYFLHQYRWMFRMVFIIIMVGYSPAIWPSNKKSSSIVIALIGFTMYLTNFPMSADHMFLKMKQVRFESTTKNTIKFERLVLGVVYNGVARAYPINILAHHHQVMDTIDNTHPLLATYCSVCRTGMIYLYPIKNGKPENLRLVGMDHFNAMFEDEETGSWWQQATGVAVKGARKGESWAMIPATQTTLGNWLQMYPNSLILQEDPSFTRKYNRLVAYDKGDVKTDLLRRETSAKHPKNWVAWIQFMGEKRYYPWEQLAKNKWLIDTVQHQKILVASPDNKSLFAFEYSDTIALKSLTLQKILQMYSRSKSVESHQEFLHSYQQFRK